MAVVNNNCHWIFDCLLASMAAVQAEDVCASFLFVCNLNGHHQEWLGSTTTNRLGVALTPQQSPVAIRNVFACARRKHLSSVALA